MTSDITTVPTGGNRVVHVGTYRLDPGDGDPPQLRAFIASGWASTPPLPFGPELVDVSADAVPAILEALGALVEASR